MESINITPEWHKVALTISELLKISPIHGIIVIVISLLIIMSMISMTVNGISKIIIVKSKEKNKKDILFKNLLEVINELNIFFERRTEMIKLHTTIIENHLIRDQMIIVESTLNQIQSDIITNFLRKVRDNYPDYYCYPTLFPEYFIMLNSLNMVKRELISEFRRITKDNHLSDKNDDEFRNYIDTKLYQIKTISINTFECYYNSPDIKLDSIKNEYDKIWNDTKHKFSDLLYTLRNIGRKYREQIKKEDEEFRIDWNNFIKSLPNNLSKGVFYED